MKSEKANSQLRALLWCKALLILALSEPALSRDDSLSLADYFADNPNTPIEAHLIHDAGYIGIEVTVGGVPGLLFVDHTIGLNVWYPDALRDKSPSETDAWRRDEQTGETTIPLSLGKMSLSIPFARVDARSVLVTKYKRLCRAVNCFGVLGYGFLKQTSVELSADPDTIRFHNPNSVLIPQELQNSDQRVFLPYTPLKTAKKIDRPLIFIATTLHTESDGITDEARATKEKGGIEAVVKDLGYRCLVGMFRIHLLKQFHVDRIREVIGRHIDLGSLEGEDMFEKGKAFGARIKATATEGEQVISNETVQRIYNDMVATDFADVYNLVESTEQDKVRGRMQLQLAGDGASLDQTLVYVTGLDINTSKTISFADNLEVSIPAPWTMRRIREHSPDVAELLGEISALALAKQGHIVTIHFQRKIVEIKKTG